MKISTFAERLTQALDIRKVTAAELSRMVGVAEGTISNYKKGTYEAKQDRVLAFSEALNVNPAWLMGYDVPMERVVAKPGSDPVVVSANATPALSPKDHRDISKALESTLAQLEDDQTGLMFDGEPLDDVTRELLESSLRHSIEMAKRLAKEKYTPKKYK